MLSLLKFAAQRSPLASLVARKLSAGSARKRHRGQASYGPEALEVRCLPAATILATLDNGTLTITDTDAVGKDNLLSVDVVGTDLVITDANEQFIAAPSGGTLSNGGHTLTVAAGLVTAGLTINGGGGTDSVEVGSLGDSFTGGLTIHGGAGADTVNFVNSTVNVGGDVNADAETISVTSSLVANGAINLQSTGDDTFLTIAGVVSAGADSKFISDKILISASVDVGAHELLLAPESTADARDQIDIGATADSAADTLQLSNAELDHISAGTITIGNSDTSTIVVSADIQHAGDSNIQIFTGRNIVFNGTGWTTHDGGLRIESNILRAAVDSFVGIDLNHATLTTTGNGEIHVQGQGGVSNSPNTGIFVHGGTVIQSQGQGKILLRGYSGIGNPNTRGTEIADAGTRITSVNGDFQIEGQGGIDGTWIRDGAVIESTGTASISVEGQGGNVANGNGLMLTGADVHSVNGNILLYGSGGLAPGQSTVRGIGIFAGSTVTSTGTATIALHGTGGIGTDQGAGVEIADDGTRLATVNAGINILAQGATSTDGYGLWIHTGAVVESTGTGFVEFDGTGGEGNSSNGVVIQGLGSATRVSAVNGGLSIVGHGGDFPQGIAAFGVVIDSCAIVQSTGLAKITIDGTAGTAQSQTRGVDILGSGTKVSSATGDIHIVGHGGSAIEGHGVYIAFGSVVQSTGTAKINVEGFGGNGLSDTRGVQIEGDGTQITSVNGAIHIIGQGGNGINDHNIGVWMVGGPAVSSTGTATITIDGTGGTGAGENHGVVFNGFGNGGATNVSSVDGDITIIGHGAADGTGQGGRGIGMYSGAFIQSTGLAKITLDGTGGGGSDSARGVELAFDGVRISSVTGDIEITGHGGPNAWARGIWLVGGPVIESTGSARITLNGTGGDGTDADGVAVESSTITSVDGDITLTGNGGNTVDGDGMRGVWLLQSSRIESTGNAKITINGTAGTGDNALRGVEISDSTIVRSKTGDINITGRGGPNAIYAFGIWVRHDAIIESTGTAKITLNGTGGDGAYGNDGVIMNGYNNGGDTQIRSLDGDISITGLGGTATGPYNWGIGMFEGAAIESTSAARITLNGTGGNGGDSNRGIEIGDDGTHITSEQGDISLTGHGGAGPRSFGMWLRNGAVVESTGAASVTLNGTGGDGTYDEHGVLLNGYSTPGDTRVSSVDGDIHITGQAGSGTNGYNVGIIVYEGATIASTRTATVNLDGTGGSGTRINYGIEMSVADTRVTSQEGAISITGHGGEGPSPYGVWVHDGAAVESTGTATVTINGTAGDATDGVGLAVNAGKVTSVDGNITLNGQGGQSAGGDGNLGVWLLFGGLVESTGNAKIFLDGTGGSGATLIRGTQLSEGGTVRSTTGDISIKGQGGAGTDGNYGVYLRGGVAESLGTARIVLDGTGGTGNEPIGVALSNNARITVTSGDVSLVGHGGQTVDGNQPRGVAVTTGSVIESLGTAKIVIDGTGGTGAEGSRGVEIGDDGTRITSATSSIQITGRGGPTVFGFGIWVRSGAVIESTGTATVNLNGTGGEGLDSSGGEVGVILNGYGIVGNTRIQAVDGDINIVGLGGNATTGVDNRGIGLFQGSTVQSTGLAKIHLDGTGGGIFAASRGIEIGDAGTNVVSAHGDISLVGHGGSGTADYGTYNMGVWIRDSAAVQSIGTDDTAAKITIDGTGHSGTSGDIGVWLTNSGRISSIAGDITITGHGGVGTGEYDDGVLLQTGSTIESIATADITVTGIGGGGTRNVKGVTVEQGAVIHSLNGDIQITGQGGSGADSDFGVAVRTDGVIRTVASGTGKVSITGTSGTGTGSMGIQIESDTGKIGVDTSAGTGNVTLITDSLNIDTVGHPGAVSAGQQSVTIRPLTAGTKINVGGADANATLGLTDAELDRVFAGNLVIGNASSGDLTVSADISRTAATNMQLITDGSLLISGGQINTTGGSLLLDAGIAPDVINPSHPSVDANAASTTLGGDLSIAVNGTEVDTQYTQLNVQGAVDLNGVNLQLAGGYIPQPGDSFIIVNNGGIHPISGKFNGLDEGDMLTFNNRLLQITYQGGSDGNDVVLSDNYLPPVANDGALTVAEDQSANGTLTAIVGNSAVVTYSIVRPPTHGTVTITDATTGAYTYTPAADYNGSDSFTFKVNDGSQDSDVATISITVTEVNDAPQLNLNGGPVTFSGKANKKNPVTVLPNVTVSDIDQSPLSGVGGGTLTISIDVAAKVKKGKAKLYDTIGGLSNASSLGTGRTALTQNSKLVLSVTLNANTTTANIQDFLRGITFTTKGNGVKQPRRILQATLTDAAGGTSNVLQQTIHVTK
jgi:hypothetical protein